MVTGRHVAGIVTGGGLGSGEAGRDGGATVISAAEQLDWSAWSPLEGGAQIAQGACDQECPMHMSKDSGQTQRLKGKPLLRCAMLGNETSGRSAWTLSRVRKVEICLA